MCGGNCQVINILPLRHPDGRLNTLACEGCAEKSGAYCLIHQRPHLGFEDGTTACKECIDEKVAAKTEEIFDEFCREVNASPNKE